MASSAAVAVALASLAGVAGAVQVAVMGQLGDRIGSVPALAFSALTTALIAAIALVLSSRSASGYAEALREPPWLWIGGAMGAIVVFAITVAGPRIGTVGTTGLLIAGQLGMAAVIDRFGFFGVEPAGIAPARVVGIVLLAAGAMLALRT